MIYMRKTLLLFAVTIGFSCFAQSEKPDFKDTPAYQKMQNEKIAYFTKEIGLTSDEAQAFWPVYFAYQNEVEEAHSKTMKALFETTQIGKNTSATESEIDKVLTNYNRAVKEEAAIAEKYYSKYKKILPASKIAKLYLAEESFKHVLLNNFRRPNGGGHAPQNFKYRPFVK